ncbi:MAG: helix-turn-helix domain-containing protein [Salinivirgaceae bacterium]
MYSKLFIAFVLVFFLSQYSAKGQITFIIESVPNSTPEDDSIFICGTFNNWEVNNSNYWLHKQLNGKYAITIPIFQKQFEYKFTRGSWMKVETNKKNEYLPNRIYSPEDGPQVEIRISNWQDLGGAKNFKYIVLYFFALAFYGLALFLVLVRIEKKDPIRMGAVILINSLLIIMLLGCVVYYQSNLIWQSYLGMSSQLLLFMWGPLFWFFTKSFKKKEPRFIWVIHFFPAIIIFLVTIFKLSNASAFMFLIRDLNPYISVGDAITYGLAIILILIYHIAIFSLLDFQLKREEKGFIEQQFMHTVFIISSIAFLAFILNFINLLIDNKVWMISNFNVVYLVISTIIYFEFYYVWKYPELLRDKGNPSSLTDLELHHQLIEFMITRKPFKEPELNITELSEMIGTKPHILSKVINEAYQKNFRDFINEYRVKEFIVLVATDEYKNYTFLALAHEVGFNSKSTFNLAFKKMTSYSPSDYLRKYLHIEKES